MDIAYLLWLQAIREGSALLTNVFNTISYFGDSTLGIVVIALTYWCFSKSLGTQMGFSVALGSGFNQLLKNIFCVYRPWIKDPRVVPFDKAMEGATGYSFPSGHSQNGMSIGGTLAVNTKKRGLKIVFFGAALLIAFSRNFLGVHTPQDVLIGLLIGGLSIVLSMKVASFVAKKKNNDIILASVLVVATVIFLLYTSMKPYPLTYVEAALLVDPVKMVLDCYRIAGVLIGLALGWLGERRLVNFADTAHIGQKVIRGVGGIVGVLVFEKLGKMTTGLLGNFGGSFMKTVLPVIFVIFIWPAIFSAFEKKRA